MKILVTETEFELEGNLVDILAGIGMILDELTKDVDYDIVKEVVDQILEQIKEAKEKDGEAQQEKTDV